MSVGKGGFLAGVTLCMLLALGACGGGGSSSTSGGSSSTGSTGGSNNGGGGNNGGTGTATAPGAPTIGTATAGNAQASVTFTSPANTGGAAISHYTATSNPGGITGICSASPCTVTGLTNGTSYTFTVTATNSAGTGPASAASNSVTPTASQSITFVNPGSQSFGSSPTLTATASSGLAVTFTSATTGVCTITSAGMLTTVTTGSCTINVNQAGNSQYQAAPQVSQTFAIAAAIPGAPSVGSATTGDGSITLTFTAPSSDGGAAITSYTATCTAAGNTTFSASGSASPIAVTGMNGGVTRSCTVTATNSAGTGSASNAMTATPLSLNPEDDTHLTVGDNYVTTTTPAVGWLYQCAATTGGGASSKGPWFNSDGTTWDETKKIAVQGSVSWPTNSFSYSYSGAYLTVTGNDLPDHNTGTFPISPSDPAYAYDTNPNSVAAQTVSWQLPGNPAVAGNPSCIQGTIGILVTGVKLFAALDKDNRDAGAWEIQDSCEGHPNASNAYHYHTGISQACLPASAQDTAGQHSPLIGFAADGFPIYGNLGQDGVPLSDADLDECHGHTHAITFNGKTVVMYHYHVTHAFPYTLGCYRGTPVHVK